MDAEREAERDAEPGEGTAEDTRLCHLGPAVSRTTVALLRRVVGREPAGEIPAEALRTADEVLAAYGTDGLRALVVSLTGWAAVHVEKDAEHSGRTYEAVLDDRELACLQSETGGLI